MYVYLYIIKNFQSQYHIRNEKDEFFFFTLSSIMFVRYVYVK
jgi:hypothetical protein